MILEKLGTPDYCLIKTDIILNLCINQTGNFKIEFLDKEIRVGYDIVQSISDIYYAKLNTSSLDLDISVFFISLDVKRLKSLILHELTHLFSIIKQDTYLDISYTYSRNLNIWKTKNINLSKDIYFYQYLCYLSLDNELNSRISELYTQLRYSNNIDVDYKNTFTYRSYMLLISFNINQLDINNFKYYNELNILIGLKTSNNFDSCISKFKKCIKHKLISHKNKIDKVISRIIDENNSIYKTKTFEEYHNEKDIWTRDKNFGELF